MGDGVWFREWVPFEENVLYWCCLGWLTMHKSQSKWHLKWYVSMPLGRKHLILSKYGWVLRIKSYHTNVDWYDNRLNCTLQSTSGPFRYIIMSIDFIVFYSMNIACTHEHTEHLNIKQLIMFQLNSHCCDWWRFFLCNCGCSMCAYEMRKSKFEQTFLFRMF